MGAATVAVLNTKINADPRGIIEGFAKAQKTVSGFDATIKAADSGAAIDKLAGLAAGAGMDVLKGFQEFASGAAGKLLTLGGAAVAAKISVGALHSTMNAIESATKTAASIGTTTERLQQLRYVASLAGNGAGTIDTGLSVLVRKIGEAAQDASGQAAKAFTQIGLSAASLNGIDTGDAFVQVAAAIDRIPTAAGKAAAAVDIFGKSGQDLLPIFAAGTAEIAKLSQEASKFGLAFSDADAAKISAANDSITRLEASFTGFIQTVAVAATPAIVALNEAILATTSLIGSVDAGTVQALASLGAFVVTARSSATAINSIIGVGGRLVLMLQKITSAQVILQALSGPKGWLTLAAGLAIAGGAAMAVNATLEKANNTLEANASKSEKAANTNDVLASKLNATAAAASNATANVKTLAEVFTELLKKGEEATGATFDKLFERGKSITLEVRTPQMKFADDVRELEELASVGAIAGDVFDKAFGNANKELRDSLAHLAEMKNRIGDIGASVSGTAGGFAALFGGIAEANAKLGQQKKIEGQIAEARALAEATKFKPLQLTEWKVSPNQFNADAVTPLDAQQGFLRGGFQGRESNFPSIINDATKGVKFPPLEAKPFPMIEAKPLPLLEAKQIPPVQVVPPKGWFDMFKADYWRKPVSQEDMSLRMAEQRNGESDSKALEQLNKTNQELLTQNKRQTAELEKLRATKTITVKQVKL